MNEKKRRSRGFTIYMTVLVILLIGFIALFVYGSATNGVQTPRLPGKGIFAMDAMRLMRHV